jgi:hypothetical protein
MDISPLTLFFTKHTRKKFNYLPFLVKISLFENTRQLPSVKPKAVRICTPVNNNRLAPGTGQNLIHIFQAYRTTAFFLFQTAGGLKRFNKLPCLFGILKQQFQLAGIEPDTTASAAVIRLDLLKLKYNHRTFANRTIHLPLHQYKNF